MYKHLLIKDVHAPQFHTMSDAKKTSAPFFYSNTIISIFLSLARELPVRWLLCG